jgi:hypothetical protein
MQVDLLIPIEHGQVMEQMQVLELQNQILLQQFCRQNFENINF